MLDLKVLPAYILHNAFWRPQVYMKCVVRVELRTPEPVVALFRFCATSRKLAGKITTKSCTDHTCWVYLSIVHSLLVCLPKIEMRLWHTQETLDARSSITFMKNYKTKLMNFSLLFISLKPNPICILIQQQQVTRATAVYVYVFPTSVTKVSSEASPTVLSITNCKYVIVRELFF